MQKVVRRSAFILDQLPHQQNNSIEIEKVYKNLSCMGLPFSQDTDSGSSTKEQKARSDEF